MTGERRPSPGYQVSLGFGLPGIFFADVAVDGAVRAAAGADPTYALGHSGVVAMLVAFAVVFASRLVFWPKVAPGTQALVRGLLAVVVGLVVAGAVAAALFVYTRAARAVLTDAFAGLALVTQIASVVWLIRYRRE